MSSGRVVYMSGEFVPEEKAKVSIYDSALMFGDMVFEMTRSFKKKQFKLREHLIRLYNGIDILNIPVGMSMDEMEELCYETIEKNAPFFEDSDEHRLMINVSRGALGIYAPIFGGDLKPTVVISDFPLKFTVASMGSLFDIEPKIKNRSRIHLQMANIEVSNWKGNNNWALLLDPDGFVAEGTGDNFFIVKDDVIITPEGRNILRGISREYIFELAEQLGLKCIEKNIVPYDVYTADEAFMTGTPFSILPVTQLNCKDIGDAKMGKVTKLLLDTWSENVGVDIVKQIQDYSKECKQLVGDAPTPYQFKK